MSELNSIGLMNIQEEVFRQFRDKIVSGEWSPGVGTTVSRWPMPGNPVRKGKGECDIPEDLKATEGVESATHPDKS